MITINNKEECCGCSACSQICPKKCIVMLPDEEGFLYPRINAEACIDCGLCERVCPIRRKKTRDESVLGAYVAYSQNAETRIQSSSGGLFSVIAEKIIAEGGIVFGVILDNGQKTFHVKAESLNELNSMRGSKYLQSDIKKTFIETKKYLQEGKRVLYTGTACQISGLKGFLRKEYDNLLTIDVLCHGVTSQKLWESYLARYNGEINNVSFRCKDTGWKKYSIELDFADKKYKIEHRNDPYMKVFLSDICLRPSCYKCEFKALDRDSDITLGDAWGVGRIMPDMDDDMGTSILIVHSDKGEKILKSIWGDLVIREGNVDKLLSPEADSRRPVKPHKNRKKYQRMLSKGNYSFETIEKMTRKTLIRRLASKMKKLRNQK